MLNTPTIQYNTVPGAGAMEVTVSHDGLFAANVVTWHGYVIPRIVAHVEQEYMLNKETLVHGNELVIDLPDGLELVVCHKGGH